eukprot:Rmarinus@m.22866
MLGDDSDFSDALRKYSVRGLDLGRFLFTGVQDTVSSSEGHVYSVTSSGTGFASGEPVAGLSVSAPVECDVDFSLSVQLYSVEENGASEVGSPVASVGIAVRAVADSPSLASSSVTETAEDSTMRLFLTPAFGGDTDSSDVLRKLYVDGAVPNELSSLTFRNGHNSIPGRRKLCRDHRLTSLSASGFASNFLVASQSVSCVGRCRAVSVEATNYDFATSTILSIGVVLSSTSDPPSVSVSATMDSLEDEFVQLAVTPSSGADTDSSDLSRRSYLSPTRGQTGLIRYRLWLPTAMS